MLSARNGWRTLTATTITLASLLHASASSLVVIRDDRGGMLHAYVERYVMMREHGTRVRLSGQCLSSCALVVGIVPRESVCAEPGAVLGFHSFNVPALGRAYSPEATRLAWALYPADVRAAIKRHWDGLSERDLFVMLPATAFFQRCEGP